MLNHCQSIAQENRSQLLDSPETDPVQYIANHPWIDRLSKRYRVDASYPETRLAYSRLTRWIQPSISSLRNEVQAHLISTLLSRLMVSDLTPHAYSIHRPILTRSHSLLTYDPTPGTPLNRVYPLRIALERFILLHSKHIFSILNALNLWLPALTECHLSDSKLFSAGAAHPARTQLILWIYAWFVCEGRRLHAITVMLCVNLSVGGRCPPHAYLRCTALGDM